MAGISNGSFGVPIDGETAISLSGLDFRKIKSVGDTRAKAVCGALGTVTLATWQGLTNHGFGIPINGTTVDIAGLNFSGISAITEIPDVINAAAAGRFLCTYDATTHVLTFLSPTLGADSTIGALIAPSTGTDISGSGYLNGGSASLTQGTGSDGTGLTMIDIINSAAAGRFVAEWDGSKVTILSPTRGVYSAVGALTAGASGTDISGASYLNGAGTAGTATAGTGADGTERPMGIYVGPEITAAAIVAGEVALDCVYVSIPDGYFDESLAVFDSEGSVTMNSIVTTTGLTVRNELLNRGLRPQLTLVVDSNMGA